MRYVILIGDENFSLDSVRAVEHYGSTNRYDVTVYEGRHCVQFEDSRIFYDYDESTDDYEEENLKKLPFTHPHFITAVYNSDERMRKVLEQDNFLKNIYIDNDHGVLLPIEEFIKIGTPIE